MMTKEQCIRLYIDRLNNDEYDKDNLPNSGHDLSPEYVAERIEEYRKVLASDFFFNDVIKK